MWSKYVSGHQRDQIACLINVKSGSSFALLAPKYRGATATITSTLISDSLDCWVLRHQTVKHWDKKILNGEQPVEILMIP